MKKESFTLLVFMTILFIGCKGWKQEINHKFTPNDWFYTQRAYPFDTIDHTAYLTAAQSIKQKIVTRSTQEGYNDPWQPVGPRNINGRITDIEMSADNMPKLMALYKECIKP